MSTTASGGADAPGTGPDPGRDPHGPPGPSSAVAPLRLLQFTDLHLFADPQGQLLGQCTRDSFAAVLTLAMARHWPPAALLLTGDLAHDGEPPAYRALRAHLRALGRPWFSIPGNHDRIASMTRYLDPLAAKPLRVHALGAWDLALLDSTVPGSEAGHLAAAILEGLDRHLAAHPDRPLLACLHHQPLPVGSRWMDTMQVDNGAALLALTARHTNLRGILWGHVHQAFDAQCGNARLLATPSTCVQFLPGSETFALDPLTPGYRWLDLYPDGRIDSGVERITAYLQPFCQQSEGY